MQIQLDSIETHPFYALQNLVYQVAHYCNPSVTPSWNAYVVLETKLSNVYKVNRADHHVADVTVDEKGNAQFRFFQDDTSQGFFRCVDGFLKSLQEEEPTISLV